MTDNLTAPLLDGTVLATDDVAGVHYPKTKLSYGADGSATDVGPLTPLPVKDASAVTLVDGQNITQVGTTAKKFADNFTSFDVARWNVFRQTGFTYAITGAELVVTTTATAADELVLIGKQNFTNPVNLMAVFRMAARNAAQEVRIGLVEVDVNGDPIPHATITGQFANVLYMVAGRITTATTGYLESISNSATAKTVTGTSLTTTAANVEYLLEVRPEDIIFSTALPDSSAVRVTTAVRLSSQVPDPNKIYRPIIWLLNTGAAAATTVSFLRFLAMDVQELQAEIGGGRGNNMPAQAIPVIQVGVPAGNTPIGNIAAATTSNGLTNYRRLSTADTNLVSIKATAGKLIGGIFYNGGGSAAFVKIYAKASAPVLASDVPIFIFPIAPNSSVNLNSIFGMYGANIATGIAMAITGGAGDTDTTAVAANQVIVNLTYV